MTTKNKTHSIKMFVYVFIKRLFDIVCSIVGIILLIPISFLVKIFYIISGDYYSIFYSQKRFGKNGKIFNLYKFRTMIPEAEKLIEKWIIEENEHSKEYLKNKKLKNDPRVTKVGKYLRKFSIDEFPQFINVLKGEMSLIGNRPYLLREKKDMGKYFKVILKSKPGITGLWQVSGRSSTSFKKRLLLEKQYSEQCSLLLDIKILILTLVTIVKGEGAL